MWTTWILKSEQYVKLKGIGKMKFHIIFSVLNN